MKLKKGSPEAKRFMAKIRAKKKPVKKAPAKKLSGLKKNNLYIDFINSKKDFKKDTKKFDTYNKAIIWGKKNIPNFNIDMIKFKRAGIISFDGIKKAPAKKIGNVNKKVKLSKEKEYYIENDNTADVLVAIKPNIFSPNVEFAMLFTEAEANKILRNSKSYKKYNINSLSGIKESNKLKKDLKAKKLRLTHGYATVKRKLSGVIKNQAEKYLQVQPSGHGHYKITTEYYNKTISCITNNMQAIDNYKSEDGSRRITKGYKSLRNECIRKNKTF